jgi:hypothetical protein
VNGYIDLIIRTYARQPKARQAFPIVGRQRFFARFGAKTLDFLVSVSHTV